MTTNKQTLCVGFCWVFLFGFFSPFLFIQNQKGQLKHCCSAELLGMNVIVTSKLVFICYLFLRLITGFWFDRYWLLFYWGYFIALVVSHFESVIEADICFVNKYN